MAIVRYVHTWRRGEGALWPTFREVTRTRAGRRRRRQGDESVALEAATPLELVMASAAPRGTMLAGQRDRTADAPAKPAQRAPHQTGRPGC